MAMPATDRPMARAIATVQMFSHMGSLPPWSRPLQRAYVDLVPCPKMASSADVLGTILAFLLAFLPKLGGLGRASGTGSLSSGAADTVVAGPAYRSSTGPGGRCAAGADQRRAWRDRRVAGRCAARRGAGRIAAT